MDSFYNFTRVTPSGGEWLSHADAVYLVFLGIATAAVVCIIGQAFLHLHHIHYYVSDELVQSNLYYIALLPPILGACSLCGMYLPRSSFFLYTICLTYLMLCLHMMVNLMRCLFKTRAALSCYLTEKQRNISFQKPPFCCCCVCCLSIRPTEQNIRHIEWMVMQAPLLRITLETVLFVSFMERSNYNVIKLIVSTLEVISMMTATWGCQILISISQEKLELYRFGTIFKLVNLTHVFFTLQKLIFDIASRFTTFDAENVIQPSVKAMFWNNAVLTLEMLLISILASVLVNQRKSAMFDQYGSRVGPTPFAAAS